MLWTRKQSNLKNNISRRALSLLLAVLLIAGMFTGITVFADDDSGLGDAPEGSLEEFGTQPLSDPSFGDFAVSIEPGEQIGVFGVGADALLQDPLSPQNIVAASMPVVTVPPIVITQTLASATSTPLAGETFTLGFSVTANQPNDGVTPLTGAYRSIKFIVTFHGSDAQYLENVRAASGAFLPATAATQYRYDSVAQKGYLTVEIDMPASNLASLGAGGGNLKLQVNGNFRNGTSPNNANFTVSTEIQSEYVLDNADVVIPSYSTPQEQNITITNVAREAWVVTKEVVGERVDAVGEGMDEASDSTYAIATYKFTVKLADEPTHPGEKGRLYLQGYEYSDVFSIDQGNAWPQNGYPELVSLTYANGTPLTQGSDYTWDPATRTLKVMGSANAGSITGKETVIAKVRFLKSAYTAGVNMPVDRRTITNTVNLSYNLYGGIPGSYGPITKTVKTGYAGYQEGSVKLKIIKTITVAGTAYALNSTNTTRFGEAEFTLYQLNTQDNGPDESKVVARGSVGGTDGSITLQTDVSGASSRELMEGTYWIRETKVPNGVMTPVNQKIKLDLRNPEVGMTKSGNMLTVTYNNTSNWSLLNLKKYMVSDKGVVTSATANQVTFSISGGPEGLTLPSSKSTDGSGMIEFFVPAGTYTLTETSCPTTHTPASPKNVTVVANSVTPTVYFYNYQKSGAELKITKAGVKTDGTAAAASLMNGAVYGVYTDAAATVFYKVNGTTDAKITIGTNGVGVISLPAGIYYVKEITPPSGYKLDPAIYTANVSAYSPSTDGGTTVTGGYNLAVTDFSAKGRVQLKKLNLSGNTFTTASQTTFEVYKLADVPSMLQAPSSKTNRVGDPITISAGASQSAIVELDAGNYVIFETVAPTGYGVPEDARATLADGTTKTITITANAVSGTAATLVTAQIKDPPLPTAQVKKVDSVTKTTVLSGASFSLYKKNASNAYVLHAAVGTTDNNGIATSAGLADGDYLWVETAVSTAMSNAGYTLAQTAAQQATTPNNAYKFNVTGGVVETGKTLIEFENVKYGLIQVVKKDANRPDPNAVYLSAKYRIYAAEQVTVSGSTITVNAGQTAKATLTTAASSSGATTGRLSPGVYYVHEYEAPTGYFLNSELGGSDWQSVTVPNNGGTITVPFSNVKKAAINLTKWESINNVPKLRLMQGVTFTLSAQGMTTKTATTNGSGYISFANLDPTKTYTLTETVKPNDMKLTSSYEIQMGSGTVRNVDYTAEKTITVTFTLDDLTNGYTANLTVYNEKDLGRFRLYKHSKINRDTPSNNAEFMVYRVPDALASQGNPAIIAAFRADTNKTQFIYATTIVTDTESAQNSLLRGTALSPYLPTGKYILIETRSAIGFQLPDPATEAAYLVIDLLPGDATLPGNPNPHNYFEFANEPETGPGTSYWARIRLKKYANLDDGTSKYLLNGARYRIYYAKETVAGSGFWVKDESRRSYSVTTGTEAGVDGSGVSEWIEMTVKDGGSVFVDNMYFIVVEEWVPDPFVVDPVERLVLVTNDASNTEEFKYNQNSPVDGANYITNWKLFKDEWGFYFENHTGNKKVTVQKVDTDNTTTKLDGAVFLLYKKNTNTGLYDIRYPNSSTEFTSKNGGYILQEYPLPVGDYRLVEKTAPNGYLKAVDTSFSVTANDVTAANKNIVKVLPDITDKKFGRITVWKITNGVKLSGAKFELYRTQSDAQAGTNKLDTGAFTSASGMAQTGNSFDDDKYYVKEVAPTADITDGSGGKYYYDPANPTIVEVELKGGRQVTPGTNNAILSETPAIVNYVQGKLTINKTFKGPDGQSFTAAPYPIASFEIFKAKRVGSDWEPDGARIETLSTTANTPSATSGYLVPGMYVVREIIAENDPYQSDYASFQQFEILAGKTVFAQANATKAVVNTSTLGRLIILKKEKLPNDNAGDPLAGAKFDIYEYDGTQPLKRGTRVATGLITDDNGTITIDLPPKRYVVVETQAPDGYALNTAENNQQDDDELVVTALTTKTVTFTNPTLGGLRIYKYWESTIDGRKYTYPLEDAVFTLYAADGTVVADDLTTQEDTEGSGDSLTQVAYAEKLNLAAGTYYLMEKDPPDGFSRIEGKVPVYVNGDESQPAVQEFIVANGPITKVYVKNQPNKGRIEIMKVDESGDPLNGAKFIIWKNSDYPRAQPTAPYGANVSQLTITEDGAELSNFLEEGAYKVMEIEAPEGYARDATVQDAVVEIGKTTTLNFANKPMIDIEYKPAIVKAVTAPTYKNEAGFPQLAASLLDADGAATFTLTPSLPTPNDFPLKGFTVRDDAMANEDQGLRYQYVSATGPMANWNIDKNDPKEPGYKITEMTVGTASQADHKEIYATVYWRLQDGTLTSGERKPSGSTFDTASIPGNVQGFEVVYDEGDGQNPVVGKGFAPGFISYSVVFNQRITSPVYYEILRIVNSAEVTFAFDVTNQAGVVSTVTPRIQSNVVRIDIPKKIIQVPVMTITKAVTDRQGLHLKPSSETVYPGQWIEYAITFTNTSANGLAMPKPIIVDNVSNDQVFADGAMDGGADFTVTGTGASSVGVATLNKDISKGSVPDTTGLYWGFKGELGAGESVTIKYRTIASTVMSGPTNTVENRAFLTSGDSIPAWPERPSGAPFDGSADWTELDRVNNIGSLNMGYWDDLLGSLAPSLGGTLPNQFKYITADASWPVNTTQGTRIEKFAQGSQKDGYKDALSVAHTSPSASFDYRLRLINNNETLLKNIRVADGFPHTQDVSPSINAQRGTQWTGIRPVLESVQGVTVYEADGTTARYTWSQLQSDFNAKVYTSKGMNSANINDVLVPTSATSGAYTDDLSNWTLGVTPGATAIVFDMGSLTISDKMSIVFDLKMVIADYAGTLWKDILNTDKQTYIDDNLDKKALNMAGAFAFNKNTEAGPIYDNTGIIESQASTVTLDMDSVKIAGHVWENKEDDGYQRTAWENDGNGGYTITAQRGGGLEEDRPLKGVTVKLYEMVNGVENSVPRIDYTDATGYFEFDQIKTSVPNSTQHEYRVEVVPSSVTAANNPDAAGLKAKYVWASQPSNLASLNKDQRDPRFNHVNAKGDGDADIEYVSGQRYFTVPPANIGVVAIDTLDAALVRKGEISGVIWYDGSNSNPVNGNREEGQGGETLLNGMAKAHLYPIGTTVDTSDMAKGRLATATVSGQGAYSFTNLRHGDYQVVFDITDSGLNTHYFTKTLAHTATSNDAHIKLDADDRIRSVDTQVASVTHVGYAQHLQNIDAGVRLLDNLIGDYVWLDLNRDGKQDAGEPGLNGIKVDLMQNGQMVRTTNTVDGPVGTKPSSDGDVAGWYSFRNVEPGDYTVRFYLPGRGTTFPAGTHASEYAFTQRDITSNINDEGTLQDTSKPALVAGQRYGDTATITVGSTTKNLNIDAGIVRVYENYLGDYLWLDLNKNGMQDAGEYGIDGIDVTLVDANGVQLMDRDGKPLIFPTRTGSKGDPNNDNDNGKAGYYEFTDLVPGKYYVKFAKPVDGDDIVIGGTTYNGVFAFTTRFDVAAGTANDSNADPATGITDEKVMAWNTEDETYDAGLSLGNDNYLGDYVWLDLSKDGTQDEGADYGVNGLEVSLRYASGAKIGQIATRYDGTQLEFPTTTGAKGDPENKKGTGKPGYYEFTDIPVGDYYVQFSKPGNGTTIEVNGKSYTSNYAFTTPKGTTAIDDATQGTKTLDSKPGADGRTNQFTVTPGTDNGNVDAGIKLVYPNIIGDYVWLDVNQNGIQDTYVENGVTTAEPGINGLTVELLREGTPDPVRTTTTNDGPVDTKTGNSAGWYAFEDLEPGSYIVRFTRPVDETDIVGVFASNYAFTVSGAGYDDTHDSNAVYENQADATAATASTVPIPVDWETSDLTIDAGVIRINNTNYLGDYFWYDKDEDGLQGEELGINGAIAELMVKDATSGNYVRAKDAKGNIIPPFLTIKGSKDAATPELDGYYEFIDLPVDEATGTRDYYVQFTKPAAPDGTIYDFTTKYKNGPDTSSDNTDSNADASGITDAITMGWDTQNPTIDAGIKESYTNYLGNYVWYDLNRDGIQGADEVGINGLEVTLRNASGANKDQIAHSNDNKPFKFTTTTGAKDDPNNANSTGKPGYYEFVNIPPGDYYVQFTKPDSGVEWTIGGAKVTSNYSFTIQGTKSNINSESPITDDSKAGTDGQTKVITVTASTNNQNVDAGVRRDYSNYIGDYVWLDENRNGIQDDGEPGIKGIKVTLHYADADANGNPVMKPDGDGKTAFEAETDENGYYEFTGIPVVGTEKLYVQFALPENGKALPEDPDGLISNYAFTTLDKEGPGNYVERKTKETKDSKPGADGKTKPFDVSYNTDNPNLDAGIIRKYDNSLGDYVWLDENADGSQDEQNKGIAGLQVRLLDSDGNVVKKPNEDHSGAMVDFVTTTDANGYYEFTNIPVGTKDKPIDYFVEFTRPDDTEKTDVLGEISKYAFTKKGTTKTSNSDSNANPPTDRATLTAKTDAITVGVNEHDKTIDAGIIRVYDNYLGDYVWLDVNGNGIQDDGETGINGLDVVLIDNNTDAIAIDWVTKEPLTTKTKNGSKDGIPANARAGYYEFRNLKPGNYTVRFTRPTDGARVQVNYTWNAEMPDASIKYAFAIRTQPSAAPTAYNNDSDGLVTTEASRRMNNATTGTISMTATLHAPEVDCGIILLSALGDYVWQDMNSNGIQDTYYTSTFPPVLTQEPAAPGVQVTLQRLVNGVWTPIGTATTNAQGLYLFDTLFADTYRVVFDHSTAYPLANYTLSPRYAGASTALDSNANPNRNAYYGQTDNIALGYGAIDRTIDAGIMTVSTPPPPPPPPTYTTTTTTTPTDPIPLGPPVSPTVPTTEEQIPLGPLVKTGQLADDLLWTALLGLALMFLGFFFLKKPKRKDKQAA